MTKTEQLTYKQIADRLGLSVDAARARVRRGKWLKITDNNGTVRVSVPLNSLSLQNKQSEQKPEHKKTDPLNILPSYGVNEETMSTMRLAIVSLQKELNRRAEDAQKDKDYLKELHDKNTDLRIRLAIAEALLAERDHPTFISNVEDEQKSGVQVNERGERSPRSWWKRFFT